MAGSENATPGWTAASTREALACLAMSLETARNIGIIVLLGLVVWLVPGRRRGRVLHQPAPRRDLHRPHGDRLRHPLPRFRGEIFSLGDAWRFALYAAVGIAIVTVAASRRLFETGAGRRVLWFGLIGGASYTLYLVWQRHRSYT